MAEEQLSRSPSGESSKMTMVLPAPRCPASTAGAKEEPVIGEVTQGGGGSCAGAAVAGPAVDRLRIDISVDAQLLHCAVAECNRPLKPPIFKCEAGHLLCASCRGDRRDEGHCHRCNRATAFVHCGRELDMYVGDARVPCPFKAYGCGLSVVYHATAAHQDACAFAPCHCSVPGCPFTASPPRLRDHLAFDHAWPLDRLAGYGKTLPLRVPAATEPHRLLVVEGDDRRLFALSVRPRGAASFAVSVSCVRTTAAAMAGPRFTCTLWARAPAKEKETEEGAPDMLAGGAGAGRRLMMETDVASCAVPGGTAVEEEGMALYVPPPMLCGPSKEMNLRVRIDVVNQAAASLRAAKASSSRKD
nr:unnamed protein product [Digitaria exilis]